MTDRGLDDRPLPRRNGATARRHTVRRPPRSVVWYLTATVAAGAVAASALPPVDLSLLAVIGLAAGFGVLRRAPSVGVALTAAFGLGLGYFATSLAWSDRFGTAVWLVLAASQAAFWVPTGWIAWSTRGRRPASAVIATAGAATLLAALRARVPLGGLEWAQLGVTAHASPLRPAAALIGTLGVTALVVALAMAFAVALERPATIHAWRPVAAALVVAGLCAVVGAAPWTRPAGTLDIAIVQADPPCPGDAAVDCPGGSEQVRKQLGSATESLPVAPDLIIWGEGALSASTPESASIELTRLVGRLEAPLLAGVTSPVPGGFFLNRNVLFGRDAQVLGTYAKRQPVPFGEYVPAREVLGGLQEVGRLVPSDMRRGRSTAPLSLGDVNLGTVSSWEVTFSRLVRDVATESHALVTLTTQATYGRAAVSDQLLRSAQLRAAELQRSVVVAATTGRSVVIEPDGTRGPTTALYSEDVLVDTVELRRGRTPFARLGDLPVLVGAITALAVTLQRQKPRSHGDAPPDDLATMSA